MQQQQWRAPDNIHGRCVEIGWPPCSPSFCFLTSACFVLVGKHTWSTSKNVSHSQLRQCFSSVCTRKCGDKRGWLSATTVWVVCDPFTDRIYSARWPQKKVSLPSAQQKFGLSLQVSKPTQISSPLNFPKKLYCKIHVICLLQHIHLHLHSY